MTKNWSGNLTYAAENLFEPASVDELAELVARRPKIRALGSRHSFNRIADTDADQVSVAALPIDMDIDSAAGTVTVGAGARYGEFVEQLDSAGWALQNQASLPHISVAGAVATGTHGSGDRNGNLASAVAGLELITADGSIRSIPGSDPDFRGSVVSLGALGIVTRVTLDVVPSFQVRQDVFENLPWDAVFDHLDEITGSAYSVSMFTNWGDGGVAQVWLKSLSDQPGPGATEQDFFGATRATRNRHPLPELSAENTTEQLGVVGPWWARLPHFKLGFTPSNGEELQSEFLVPRRNALAALAAVRPFAERIHPHLFITEIRTIAADSLWLSPSHGEDCIGIHFTWKQHIPEVEALLVELGQALAPFSARPHWGKLFQADAAMLDAVYSQLPAFRELAARYDPDRKFSNDFLDRLVFA